MTCGNASDPPARGSGTRSVVRAERSVVRAERLVAGAGRSLVRAAPGLSTAPNLGPAAGVGVAHDLAMLPAKLLSLAAASSGGLLDARQLTQAGCDRRRVSEWVTQGLLERVARGQYRVSAAPIPLTQCLHLPLRRFSDGLISGEAVLALRGLDGHTLPMEPLVLVDHGSHPRAPGPYRVRRVHLASVPRQVHHGVPTGDLAQALADHACDPDVTDNDLRLAVDGLRGQRWFPVGAMLPRWRRIGHEGAWRMLALARELELESEGERRALRQLFVPHGPLPDCQVWVLPRRRVDFLFAFAGLILEYRGVEAHDGQVDIDALRTMDLERPGLREVVLTKSMLRIAPEVMQHVHALRTDRERLVLEGRLALPPLPPQHHRVTPLRTLRPDN